MGEFAWARAEVVDLRLKGHSDGSEVAECTWGCGWFVEQPPLKQDGP